MTGQAVAKYCYFFFLSLSLLSCCVAKIQNDANGFEIEYRLIKTKIVKISSLTFELELLNLA
jgi:hypothetical protein